MSEVLETDRLPKLAKMFFPNFICRNGTVKLWKRFYELRKYTIVWSSSLVFVQMVSVGRAKVYRIVTNYKFKLMFVNIAAILETCYAFFYSKMQHFIDYKLLLFGLFAVIIYVQHTQLSLTSKITLKQTPAHMLIERLQRAEPDNILVSTRWKK